jgi:hypothetical protein
LWDNVFNIWVWNMFWWTNDGGNICVDYINNMNNSLRYQKCEPFTMKRTLLFIDLYKWQLSSSTIMDTPWSWWFLCSTAAPTWWWWTVAVGLRWGSWWCGVVTSFHVMLTRWVFWSSSYFRGEGIIPASPLDIFPAKLSF